MEDDSEEPEPLAGAGEALDAEQECMPKGEVELLRVCDNLSRQQANDDFQIQLQTRVAAQWVKFALDASNAALNDDFTWMKIAHAPDAASPHTLRNARFVRGWRSNISSSPSRAGTSIAFDSRSGTLQKERCHSGRSQAVIGQPFARVMPRSLVYAAAAGIYCCDSHSIRTHWVAST